ncbi:unnamed protein product [Nippostrongylus brasiliensis]|uniref:WW domain-containing protein n=1 Tax=Nippostrongylus brasiliensis TaxID=27835 RepID=A0A0N4Y6X5_NIPBR|nr:unnamed protein product [Nippostrongylus brasiliensis]
MCSSHQDEEKHIYANIREMDELNNRPFPPVPDVADVPRRNLNNGWMEYETEAGRTYFYNFETGKSQWIPPRFIRTPAQVQVSECVRFILRCYLKGIRYHSIRWHLFYLSTVGLVKTRFLPFDPPFHFLDARSSFKPEARF